MLLSVSVEMSVMNIYREAITSLPVFTWNQDFLKQVYLLVQKYKWMKKQANRKKNKKE